MGKRVKTGKVPLNGYLTTQQKEKVLTRLYAVIPAMDCLPGCTACCGHTAWSRFEWYSLAPEVRANFNFFRMGCDFVKNGKCSVYAKRPFMCRIFGTVEQSMQPWGQIKNAVGRCPHGVAPEKRLTAAQAKKLTLIYYKCFF
jgi:hypothetical protein